MGFGASKLFVRRGNQSKSSELAPSAPLTRPASSRSIRNGHASKFLNSNDPDPIYCPPPPDHALTNMDIRRRSQSAKSKPADLAPPPMPSVTTLKSDVVPAFETAVTVHNAENPRPPTSAWTTDVKSSKTSSYQAIEKWQKPEVERWLTENGLTRFKAKFEQFDGLKLLALHDMYLKAPSVYFKEIKRFLDKPGLDCVLQVTSALARLEGK